MVIGKTELVSLLAEELNISKNEASQNVNAFCKIVMQEVGNKNKIALVGFGSFEAKERAAHKGRNPATGEEINIPASVVPVFKPGKSFKEIVR